MKWFNVKEITTLEELRKQYKKLLMKHHPDNGGNEEITKEIITEYDVLFAHLKAKSYTEGKSSTNTENDEDNAFKEVLSKIIGFNMEIEIIGSWIWCFDCYAYREVLKELGFKWSPKKKAWIWHYGEYKRNHKEIPLDEIRAKYGSEKVTNKHHNTYVLN